MTRQNSIIMETCSISLVLAMTTVVPLACADNVTMTFSQHHIMQHSDKMIFSTQTWNFLGRVRAKCDIKSAVLISNGNYLGGFLKRLASEFGIDFIYHDPELNGIDKEWVRQVYVDHVSEYFIIATHHPRDVLEAVESVFLEEPYNQLAVLPHRTKWMVIAWEGRHWEEVTNRPIQSVLDNVVMLQLSKKAFGHSSSTVDITNITTLMWRENRTRELSQTNMTSLDMTCKIFPNRRHGLNGRKLKAVPRQFMKLFLHVQNISSDGTPEYAGLLVDVLNYTTEKMNFTYDMVFNYNISGDYNISWTVFNEFVESGSVAFGLSGWSNLNIRYNFSYSYPVLFDKIIGIYRRPSRTSIHSSLFFLLPFPVIIYLYLFLCLMFTVLLYNIVSTLTPPENVKHRSAEFPRESKLLSSNEDCKKIYRSIKNALLNYLASHFAFFVSILNQSYLPRPRRMSARLVVGIWAIGIVFFNAVFSSSLTAEMIKKSKEFPLKTFEELLARNDYSVTSFNKSVATDVIKASKNGTLARLGEIMTVVDSHYTYGLIDESTHAYLESMDEKTVVIFYESALKSWLYRHPHPEDYIIMEDDPLFFTGVSIVFPDKSELNDWVSNTFIDLYDFGLHANIYKLYDDKDLFNRSGQVVTKGASSLPIKSLYYLLIVCLVCVAVAVVVLGIEILEHRSKVTLNLIPK